MVVLTRQGWLKMKAMSRFWSIPANAAAVIGLQARNPSHCCVKQGMHARTGWQGLPGSALARAQR